MQRLTTVDAMSIITIIIIGWDLEEKSSKSCPVACTLGMGTGQAVSHRLGIRP
jgi:hypothetical protein